MGAHPHAAGPGGTGALPVRFHRARTITLSTILAAAAILASVVTALADGGTGPIPR